MNNQLVIFDHIIPIREDQFLDLTVLCKLAGKKLNHYLENKATREYISEVEQTGISACIEIGSKDRSHTFAHPLIAIHCAYWCSPKFAIEVNSYYLRIKSGDLTLIPEVISNNDRINELETQIIANAKQLTAASDENTDLYHRLSLTMLENQDLKKRDEEVTALTKKIITNPLVNPSVINESNILAMQHNSNTILATQTNLKPLVQIANELGYTTTRDNQKALGKHISKWYNDNEDITTHREKKLGGVLHMSVPIWWYEHTVELEEQIHKFFKTY